MLVISRKIGESIKLADDIEITVIAVENQRVRLGIRAPKSVAIRRVTPEVDLELSNREAALPQESMPSILSQAASAERTHPQ